jgi:ASC-1-like (ASCH) protein
MTTKKADFYLHEPYFSLTCIRVKDIHSDINKGEWKNIVSGDIITFYNNDSKKTRKVDVRVVEKNLYSTFREMLKTEGLKRIYPNIDNIDQGVIEYYKTNQPNDEAEFKISSIRFQVIEDYPEGWTNFKCIIS